MTRPAIWFYRSTNGEQTENHNIAEVSIAIQVVFQACPHFSIPPFPFIVRMSSGTGRRLLHNNNLIFSNRELNYSNTITQ